MGLAGPYGTVAATVFGALGVFSDKQSQFVLHAVRVLTLIAQVLAISIGQTVMSQSQLCWLAKLRCGGRT